MLSKNGKNMCSLCFSITEPKTHKCPNCDGKSNIEKYPGALPEGTILSGKYYVGKALGRGGFGVTYLCYDLRNDREVAIKEFLPDSIVHRNSGETTVQTVKQNSKDFFKEGAEKFYEEAKLVSRFNGNPNIISVYEFFYENNTTYFVMEYLEGCDLKSYIASKGGRISESEALYIVDRIAEALVIVHSTGILHRDISPDNIYLCSDGNIKLIDFGAARQVVGEASKSLSTILKPGFAPLEQYQRKGNQGPWTDIYALGATLYYAVKGVAIDDAMTRIQDEALDFSGVTPALATIISKMLAPRIEERFGSATEFRAAVNEAGIAITPPVVEKVKPKNAFCANCGKEIPSGYTHCSVCEKKKKDKSEHVTLLPVNKKLVAVVASVAVVAVAATASIVGIVSNRNDSRGEHFAVVFDEIENKVKNDVKWNISDGVLYIAGEGAMDNYLYDEQKAVALTPWEKRNNEIRVVEIGAGISHIGENAFADCNVDSFNVSPENENYASEGGVLYNKDKTKLIRYPAMKYDAEFVIPDTVKQIESYAFKGSNFTKLFVPAGVSEIGKAPLADCAYLQSIEVATENAHYVSIDGVLYSKDRTNLVCHPQQRLGSTYDIPEGTINIEDYAFNNCEKLASISIPTSVSYIGNRALSDCLNLKCIGVSAENTCYTSVDGVLYSKDKTQLIVYPGAKPDVEFVIPLEVTSIAHQAVYNTQFLEIITIPAGLSDIGEKAFVAGWSMKRIVVDENNPALCSVDGILFNKDKTELLVYPAEKTGSFYDIPQSVKKVGNYAFFSNVNLISVSVPANVDNIGVEAFSACSTLESIMVDESNRHYTSVDGVLYNKSMTELLHYPTKKKDKEFEIPMGVSFVGAHVFYNNASVENIVIPASVVRVAFNTFTSCYKLKGIAVAPDNNYYMDMDGVLFSKDAKALYVYPGMKNAEETEYAIPEGVQFIGINAFLDSDYLEYVSIPGSVGVIGEDAFACCNALKGINCIDSVYFTSVEGVFFDKALKRLIVYPAAAQQATYVIPDGVVNIENNAFFNNVYLSDISIPDSVEYIGVNAYECCSKLEKIVIPKSVAVMDMYDVANACTSLKSITVDPENKFFMSENCVLFTKDKKALIRYPANKDGTAYSIPSETSFVMRSAFWRNDKLSSINIPASVAYIGDTALVGCFNLKSVGVEPENAWYTAVDGVLYSKDKTRLIKYPGAKKGNDFVIPNEVKSVAAEAFGNVQHLRTLTIHAGVTDVGEEAFVAGLAMEKIVVDANNPVLCSVDGVLFNKDKTELIVYPAKKVGNSYEIPYGVKTIKLNAFFYTPFLRSVVIPDSVQHIENFAFYGSRISTIKIPYSVTSLGSQVFTACNNLSKIEVIGRESAHAGWKADWNADTTAKVVWNAQP